MYIQPLTIHSKHRQEHRFFLLLPWNAEGGTLLPGYSFTPVEGNIIKL